MWTLRKMDKGVIKDYYHMTIMDENMKITHLFLDVSSNLRPPFCASTFTSRFLITLLNVHTRENLYLSLMYSTYANASNNTPSYTHVSLYVVWRVPKESTPWEKHNVILIHEVHFSGAPFEIYCMWWRVAILLGLPHFQITLKLMWSTYI